MNAAADVSAGYISKNPGIRFGKACIAGTRISVQDVFGAYEHGMPPQEIAEYFSGGPLTLSQIHAALAYAYDHLDELAADKERGQKYVDEYFAAHPPKMPQILKERRGE